MKLEVGIYKVKLKSLIEEFAILEVYHRNGHAYYSINNGPENELDWLTDRDPCQVIKQLKGLNVQGARMEIKFRDVDGDYYSFPASSVQVVKQIFTKYPEVGRALGSKKAVS
ncbi:MAG: hypothetical protein MJA30_06400 [Cytophagales bacterium]|nr:hypothetical protein [Cytophagales bacterium]